MKKNWLLRRKDTDPLKTDSDLGDLNGKVKVTRRIRDKF